MAKAFLLRWGMQIDFDTIKLQVRELGYAEDTEKLLLGTEEGNVHIPNENYVKKMISSDVQKYKVPYGNSNDLTASQQLSGFGYNTSTKRLTYKRPNGDIVNVTDDSRLPLKTANSVVVSAENIDSDDNNSVTIAGYNRPIELIFKNGVLCTTLESDTNRYTVNYDTSTLKVYNCAENDIISYF